jgi:hypothetical protein
MANSKGYFSQLPTWAKGTIAIVGVLAIGGIGFAIFRGIKKGIEKAKESKESREAKDDLVEAQQQGIQPTISNSEAESKVSSLLEAADDCDPTGSGATQIIAVIKTLKNKADYLLLTSKFGTKTWADCWPGQVTGSLTTLLVAELDGGQMKTVREHLASIGVNI